MNNPLVSIVVPVYQGMPFLESLVESITRQTYSNLELVAAVTPCGDDSEKLLRDRGFTVISTPEGTSAADNWTIATQAAHGDFTKLICQDDILYPHAISVQVEDLLAQKSAVMAVSQRDIIDSSGKVLFRQRGLTGLNGDLTDGLVALRKTYTLGGNVFGEPLAVLFRSEVLQSVMPWRDDNPLMLDLNTYSRVATQGSIALRRGSIGAFRVSSQSWSTRLSREQLNQTKQWQQEYEASHAPGRIDRMRAVAGRHLQTNIRRAAYAYLSLRGSL